jgi:hypothetical protein
MWHPLAQTTEKLQCLKKKLPAHFISHPAPFQTLVCVGQDSPHWCMSEFAEWLEHTQERIVMEKVFQIDFID